MTLVLQNVQFLENKASGIGGAVHWSCGGSGAGDVLAGDSLSRCSVQVTQSTFRFNSASTGGALHVSKMSRVRVTNVLASANKVSWDGGVL